MTDKTVIQQEFEDNIILNGHQKYYPLGDKLIVVSNDTDFLRDLYDYSTQTRKNERIPYYKTINKVTHRGKSEILSYGVNWKGVKVEIPDSFDKALTINYETIADRFMIDNTVKPLIFTTTIYTDDKDIFDEYMAVLVERYVDLCGEMTCNGYSIIAKEDYPKCTMSAIIDGKKFQCFDSDKYFDPINGSDAFHKYYDVVEKDKVISYINAEITTNLDKDNSNEM